jgi:hypothetical protein
MSRDVQLTLQFIVGLTFLSSVFGKILASALFFDGLRDYRLLPPWSVNHAGVLLIAVEGLIALSYLSGSLLRPVGILALVLSCFFMLVTSVALKRGTNARCLCFGASDTEPVSVRTVARILLLAAVVLVLLTRSSELDGWLATAYSGRQILLALASAVLAQILVSWTLAIPELARLVRGCRGCGRRAAET